jgi:hypothetical protein
MKDEYEKDSCLALHTVPRTLLTVHCLLPTSPQSASLNFLWTGNFCSSMRKWTVGFRRGREVKKVDARIPAG